MISRPVRPLAAIVLLAAVALGVSGCGGSSTMSDAATITFKDARGDQTVHITRDALLTRVEETNKNSLFRELAASAGYKPSGDGETSDANLTAFWLSQMINQAVIDAEFTTQHLQVSAADKADALKAAQANFAKAQGDTTVFDAFPKKVRDELVDARARLDVVLRSCPSGRLVEHILLRTKANAEAAYEQIRAGAQFDAVARAKSIDTGSAQQGGLLGCVAPGEFVKEFQKVADEAPFDTVTIPVKTKFGYHLILVRRWDPTLAVSNQQIAQGLQQAAGAALDARVKALHVKVDPRFGTWGLHDSPQGQGQGQKAYNVSPPAAPTPRTAREKG